MTQAITQQSVSYQRLLESMADAVLVIDQDWVVRFANPAAAALTGYTIDQLIDTPCPFDPPFDISLNASSREISKGERERSASYTPTDLLKQSAAEIVFAPQNSTENPSDMLIAEVIFTQIEWVHSPAYLASLRDITERKQLEQELRHHKTRYHAILQDQTEMICRFQPDGTLSFVNDAYCRYFQKSRQELLGSNFISVVRPDNQNKVRQHILSITQDNPVITREYYIQMKNGPNTMRENLTQDQSQNHFATGRWQQWTDRALFDDTGQIVEYQATGRDITELKNAEEALLQLNTLLERRVDERTVELKEANSRLMQEVQDRKQAEEALAKEREMLTRRVTERTADLSAANAELARSARLKDEFLANMSHELRTPLNAILGLSEALKEEVYGSLTDRQTRTIGNIEMSGRHLLDLINDILDVSKIEAGKLTLDFTPVSIHDICEASLSLIRQSAEKKQVQIKIECPSDVRTINADERRLRQVLVNLLSNAVKFTPKHGTIGLKIVGDTEQDTVHFTVWDTGIGIEADDMNKLFRPFIQLDSSLSRQNSGTGLGLIIVHRLVEAHGGSVVVESSPGQGSRFTLSMPWQQSKIEVGAPVPIELSKLMEISSIKRVLIVEDSPTAADQIYRYLSEWHIHAKVQTSGEGILERIELFQPNVIILDLLLPGLSGWEILAKIKENPQTQAIPVIIISVIDERAYGLSVGAADYLIKPVSRHALGRALTCSINQGGGAQGQTRQTHVQQGHSQLKPESNQSTIPTGQIDSSVEVALCSDGSYQARRPDAFIMHPDETTRSSNTSNANNAPLILIAEDNLQNIRLYSDRLISLGYRVTVAQTGLEAVEQTRDLNPALLMMNLQMHGLDGLETVRHIRANPDVGQVPIIALTTLVRPGDQEKSLQVGVNHYLRKPINLEQLATIIDSYLGIE
ncbi:MAG: response regulator [Chloroflexota bacterium]